MSARARSAIIALLGLLTLAPTAHALSDGIIGYSGKQGATCNSSQCHGGGVAPHVAFGGPVRVLTDSVATFRFTVASQSTSQNLAGLDVAAGGGVLSITPDQMARTEQGEITHDAPREAVDGAVTWEFTWQAPEAVGRYVLYGAGLSANGSGTRSGDRAAATTFAVDVLASPPRGDANCDLTVSAADLAALVSAWPDGALPRCEGADVDCDGALSDGDLLGAIDAMFAPPSAACPA